MRIIGGHTASVYRSTRDRMGDKTSETLLATVDHVVYQPGVWNPTTGEFEESASQTSTLFFPRGTDVRAKDRVVMDGRLYRVVGTAWDEDHPSTGRSFAYFAVAVETTG
ncbi:MAG: hypothetical protein JST91_29685 [Actinobacteria bacterium]|nr:hypothetical protein [Actinomycetota bacterium]